MKNFLNDRIARARKDEAGFTLIELLVVIVILGILSAIVVFSVNGITDKGQASACKSEKNEVQTAVEAYYAQSGNYPTSMTDLTTGQYKFLNAAPSYYSIDSSHALTLTAAGTSAGCTL